MENKEKLYFVHAIGSDRIYDGEAKSYADASAEMKEVYDKCLADHDGGSWFDEAYLEDGEFTISGKEYYQCASVIPVNDADGAEYLIEKIRRKTRDVDTFATCYQYELLECGVFDATWEIQNLLDKLEALLKGQTVPA